MSKAKAVARHTETEKPLTLTFTPTGNLESPTCLWTVGGSRSTRRKPTQKQQECLREKEGVDVWFNKTLTQETMVHVLTVNIVLF